ncbi:MAG: hypothetical protein E7320_02695 [Clostridiales bacterium]|nr:hypothetical protein [Clostridiales bacterium]
MRFLKHRLFMIEGLPCSGKSTLSAYTARHLEAYGSVCFVDEGTGDHPADYEFHALAPAAPAGEKRRIVSLAQYSGEALEALLPYKIYDGLPWLTEQPLMLEKWQRFVESANTDTRYVFNCVLLQNPMCETMMRFGFPERASAEHIAAIAEIIKPLEPVVIYLRNNDIAASVRKASAERPGWLDAVIPYHTEGAYGKSIGAEGFEGYIRCLRERQERELRILAELPVRSCILEDPQKDWDAARMYIDRLLQQLIP